MDYLYLPMFLLAVNLGAGLGLLFNLAMSPLYRRARNWIQKQ